MQGYDIPRDVISLLKDAETYLAECLQNEKLSGRAREQRDEILHSFGQIRNRYGVEFALKGGEAAFTHTGQDDYDDIHNASYAPSQASDEVSVASDYVENDSEVEEELDKIFKQGYLERRKKDHGFFGSEWQKRWCVLTTRAFLYYSSEKGKQPKNGFLIKDSLAQMMPYIRKDSRRDSCFEVVTPNQQVFQFTAASPSDARDWVEQIQFLVKDTQSTIIPYEDDEETYDDIESTESSPVVGLTNDSENSLQEDDVYESIPGDEETEESEDENYEMKPGEPVIFYGDYYQGLWNCFSDNSDELSFERGDLIHILSKEYHAYGWWVGELDGIVGIVPKDYLTLAFDL
ncbi:src kinase-associated phosphoprotein 1 [Xenopus tropicalis]|uniref:Src kinase-associated phosphoprotein 1 n=1 Tax=Xenopus tropicalis TaxID=8364 RepID=SKAP1_XENTR|eukprot:NP_001004990.1 src kinase-associated phosphoprotein 1 [Xenopus tropicalis]